jgi:hypothetical protein
LTAADGTRWLIRRAWRPHRVRIEQARVEHLFWRWVVPTFVLGWLAIAVTGIVSGEVARSRT